MELNFDSFKNAQNVDLYLCNPDRKELGIIYANEPKLTLRLNSLSQLSFIAPKYITDSNGESVEHPYYSKIKTKRLIKVDKVGWFKITEAIEKESTAGVYKEVTAESHESIFKDMGFVTENRLYKFYDEEDEKDEQYDASILASIPSVVGQLYQQLGIDCNLEADPDVDQPNWTIISIDEALKYKAGNQENICRTFKSAETIFGYDFMMNNVSKLFQVVFEFDFLHHSIKVKTANAALEKTNIYLSFENLIKELNISEKSDDIVTVLSCSGDNLDIRSVNPMGTNYICDFSYFMGDSTNGYPWMSEALTERLEAWKEKVEAQKSVYKGYVENLFSAYQQRLPNEERKKYIDRKLQDIEKTRDNYITDNTYSGVCLVEDIEIGECSLAENSVFKDTVFSSTATKGGGWNFYTQVPTYTSAGFSFDASAKKTTVSTFDALISQSGFDQSESLYFFDGDDTKSYCEVSYEAKVVDGEAVYSVKGFDRYTVPCLVSEWCNIYGQEQLRLENATKEQDEEIAGIKEEMARINDATNILKQFADTEQDQALFRELKNYWIEGDYTNENLAGLDGTTIAENLELATQLMEAGATQLSYVCKPQLTFNITAANFLKMHAFALFANELALGKTITIEKSEDVHYEAALTEMSFGLDDSSNFNLVFSNTMRPTDWGFKYADIVQEAATTSRTVSANWSNLMGYANEKSNIESLLYNSLDRTLRAGQGNMYSQEFIVDNTGILGRKKKDDGSYENQQLRIINNLICFTDDNWESIRTALGKIEYEENGQIKSSYGLNAETIIGKLIMGERLQIGDDDSNVIINKDGITVTNGRISSYDYKAADDLTKPYSVSGIVMDLTSDNQGYYIQSPTFTLGAGDNPSYFRGNLVVTSLKIEEDATIGGVLRSSDYDPDENTGFMIDFTPQKEDDEGRVRYIISPYFKLTNQSAAFDGHLTSKEATLGGFNFKGNTISLKQGEGESDIPFATITNDGKVNLRNAIFGGVSSDTVINAYQIKNGSIYLSLSNTAIGAETGTVHLNIKCVDYDEDMGHAGQLKFDVQLEEAIRQDMTINFIFGYGVGGSVHVTKSVTIYAGYTYPTKGDGGVIDELWADVVHCEYYSDGTTEKFRLEDNTAMWWVESIDIPEMEEQGFVQGGGTLITTTPVDKVENAGFLNIGGCQKQYNVKHYTYSPGMATNVSFIPAVEGKTLGDIKHPWGDIYSTKAKITQVTTETTSSSNSDKNVKNSIEALPAEYETFFDGLQPVRYKMNSGTSDRYHIGFIAQSVEQSLVGAGLTTQDFAGFIHYEEPFNGAEYGLRYGEFIALNTVEIQKLKTQIKELQRELKEIKGNET